MHGVTVKILRPPFHEKLLTILEILTNGVENKSRYAEENIRDTIKRFINKLNNSNSLVVFDNIDAFAAKETNSFVGTLKLLFDELTSQLKQGLIILTCRSSIKDHHLNYLEVPLSGLSLDESIKLASKFDIYDNPVKKDMIEKFHKQTKGHALWLNLIFGQVRNERLTVNQINEIFSYQENILDDKILNSIWTTLNKNEKEIISIISVFTRPPNILQIHKSTNIPYYKIKKILVSLLNLRLILEVNKEGVIHYDLHPIIKIKASAHPKPKQRKEMLKNILAMLGGDWKKLLFIAELYETYKESIEDYVQCAEIATQYYAYDQALDYLNRLSGPLLKFGEDSKFLELCDNLFNEIDNKLYELGLNEEYSQIFEQYIHTLLEQGEYEKVNEKLNAFGETLISIKQYIYYVELNSYSLWFQNYFKNAVNFIMDAIEKIEGKQEKITYEIYNNLALANRDYGNVDEALKFYLIETPLELLNNWEPTSKDCEDYSSNSGNISRCFYLLKDYTKSLFYCEKSLLYLEKSYSRQHKVNYGYGLLWLADTYVKLQDYDKAIEEINNAKSIWTKYCPSRLKKIEEHIKEYPKRILNQIKL